MLRFNLISVVLTAKSAGLPFSGLLQGSPESERSMYAPLSNQGRR
jgi:hypothetical protein